jgi:hypothetical protein
MSQGLVRYLSDDIGGSSSISHIAKASRLPAAPTFIVPILCFQTTTTLARQLEGIAHYRITLRISHLVCVEHWIFPHSRWALGAPSVRLRISFALATNHATKAFIVYHQPTSTLFVTTAFLPLPRHMLTFRHSIFTDLRWRTMLNTRPMGSRSTTLL